MAHTDRDDSLGCDSGASTTTARLLRGRLSHRKKEQDPILLNTDDPTEQMHIALGHIKAIGELLPEHGWDIGGRGAGGMVCRPSVTGLPSADPDRHDISGGKPKFTATPAALVPSTPILSGSTSPTDEVEVKSVVPPMPAAVPTPDPKNEARLEALASQVFSFDEQTVRCYAELYRYYWFLMCIRENTPENTPYTNYDADCNGTPEQQMTMLRGLTFMRMLYEDQTQHTLFGMPYEDDDDSDGDGGVISGVSGAALRIVPRCNTDEFSDDDYQQIFPLQDEPHSDRFHEGLRQLQEMQVVCGYSGYRSLTGEGVAGPQVQRVEKKNLDEEKNNIASYDIFITDDQYVRLNVKTAVHVAEVPAGSVEFIYKTLLILKRLCYAEIDVSELSDEPTTINCGTVAATLSYRQVATALIGKMGLRIKGDDKSIRVDRPLDRGISAYLDGLILQDSNAIRKVAVEAVNTFLYDQSQDRWYKVSYGITMLPIVGYSVVNAYYFFLFASAFLPTGWLISLCIIMFLGSAHTLNETYKNVFPQTVINTIKLVDWSTTWKFWKAEFWETKFWKSVFSYQKGNGEYTDLKGWRRAVLVGGFFVTLAGTTALGVLSFQSVLTVMALVGLASHPVGWAIAGLILLGTILVSTVSLMRGLSVVLKPDADQALSEPKVCESFCQKSCRLLVKAFRTSIAVLLSVLSAACVCLSMLLPIKDLAALVISIFKTSETTAGYVGLGFSICGGLAQIPFTFITVYRSIQAGFDQFANFCRTCCTKCRGCIKSLRDYCSCSRAIKAISNLKRRIYSISWSTVWKGVKNFFKNVGLFLAGKKAKIFWYVTAGVGDGAVVSAGTEGDMLIGRDLHSIQFVPHQAVISACAQGVASAASSTIDTSQARDAKKSPTTQATDRVLRERLSPPREVKPKLVRKPELVSILSLFSQYPSPVSARGTRSIVETHSPHAASISVGCPPPPVVPSDTPVTNPVLGRVCPGSPTRI